MSLDALREYVADQFASMTIYLDTAHHALQRAEQQLGEDFLEIRLFPSLDKDDLRSKYDDIRSKYKSWYHFRHSPPRIFRNSFFIYLHGFLEETLFIVCRHVQTRDCIDLAATELKGDTLEQVQTYIKRVARLPFPDQTERWSNLMVARLLRNWIIHHDGRLPQQHKKMDKVLAFIKRTEGIRIEENEIVIHDVSFLHHMIALLKQFADAVIEGVIKK